MLVLASGFSEPRVEVLLSESSEPGGKGCLREKGAWISLLLTMVAVVWLGSALAYGSTLRAIISDHLLSCCFCLIV
ncbi:hypothetical protein NW841_06125 [Synechococcus sp. H60.3]|uniref:hypothetical protein n=1 Tax=Synechococcus sp. H60.3 TaxID=2967124 RepID=UPI0039C137D7